MARLTVTPYGRAVPATHKGGAPSWEPTLKADAPARLTDAEVRDALRRYRANLRARLRHPPALCSAFIPLFEPGKTTTADYVRKFLGVSCCSHLALGMHEGRPQFPPRWHQPAPYLTDDEDRVTVETLDDMETDDEPLW